MAVLAWWCSSVPRILSSDIGLELYMLGVDEPTGAAMGVRTSRRKLELHLPASLVDSTAELTLLMMLFVGGRKSILGAVAGSSKACCSPWSCSPAPMAWPAWSPRGLRAQSWRVLSLPRLPPA